MTPFRRSSTTAARRPRTRAFTFIELLIAVALSTVLIRGMYTILASATELTRISDQKTSILLEASALFDTLSDDLSRVPFSGPRYFSVGASQITFRVTSKTGGDDIYIRYSYNSSAQTLRRKPCKNQDGTGDVDEDGDGTNDPETVVARRVSACEFKYHVSGTIDGSWGTGTTADTKAVKCILTILGQSSSAALTDMTFTLVFPILSL